METTTHPSSSGFEDAKTASSKGDRNPCVKLLLACLPPSVFIIVFVLLVSMMFGEDLNGSRGSRGDLKCIEQRDAPVVSDLKLTSADLTQSESGIGQ